MRPEYCPSNIPRASYPTVTVTFVPGSSVPVLGHADSQPPKMPLATMLSVKRSAADPTLLIIICARCPSVRVRERERERDRETRREREAERRREKEREKINAGYGAQIRQRAAQGRGDSRCLLMSSRRLLNVLPSSRASFTCFVLLPSGKISSSPRSLVLTSTRATFALASTRNSTLGVPLSTSTSTPVLELRIKTSSTWPMQ